MNHLKVTINTMKYKMLTNVLTKEYDDGLESSPKIESDFLSLGKISQLYNLQYIGFIIIILLYLAYDINLN